MLLTWKADCELFYFKDILIRILYFAIFHQLNNLQNIKVCFETIIFFCFDLIGKGFKEFDFYAFFFKKNQKYNNLGIKVVCDSDLNIFVHD